MTTLATPTTISSLSTAKSATWAEYLHHVEDSKSQEERVFFHQDTLWIDMGNEGINHARFSNLLTMILFAWLTNLTIDLIIRLFYYLLPIT